MEVYHRVKNNLQMVGSFVNLQARRVQDPAARAALEPIRTRVQAMSLVHERLYRSSDLETVSIDALLGDIARGVAKTGAPPPRLEMDLDPHAEPQARAIPLALFVNECMTNALRHGVPGAEVRMTLRVRPKAGAGAAGGEDGAGGGAGGGAEGAGGAEGEDGGAEGEDVADGFVLTIENALPEGVEAEGEEGLGSKLTLAFARQLRAELEVERSAAAYRVRLIVPPAAIRTEDRGGDY